MNYLRGFVPWIVFAVVSAVGWQWAALTGLVLALALFADGRRRGTPLDSQALEISTTVYFAVLTTFAFLAPTSPVQHFVGAISMAWVIAFTLTSLVLTVLDVVQAGAVATILTQVAGFVIPAIFTARYPEHVRSRQDA